MSRQHRMMLARQWASGLFVAAIGAALLAVWMSSGQWAATAGVLLFAAIVCAVVATP